MDYLNQLLIQPAITSLTLTLSVGGAFLIGIAAKAAWIFGEAGKFLTIGQQVVRGLTFAVSTAGASVFGGMLSAAANKQSLYSSKTWQGIGYGAAVGAGLGFLGGGAGTKLMRSLRASPAAAPAAGDAAAGGAAAGGGDAPIAEGAAEGDAAAPAEAAAAPVEEVAAEPMLPTRPAPLRLTRAQLLNTPMTGWLTKVDGNFTHGSIVPRNLPPEHWFIINRNQAIWHNGATNDIGMVTNDSAHNGYTYKSFINRSSDFSGEYNGGKHWFDTTDLFQE
jgi:hypothetical protein